MKENPSPFAFLAHLRRRPVLLGVLAFAGIVALVVVMRSSRPTGTALSFFEVKRGDFLISIVEGGTIEAVSETIIRSEVEGTARIIFIVPEGSIVKKGDLLVELDSSQVQDAVNLQQINVEKAQFALIQAEKQLEIQKSTVESEVDAAELKVEFAESDLEKYTKGEAQQTRRNAQIEITNVLETLQINEERLGWSEELHKKGFETKANLDKDRLAVSQSTLKLEQARQALWMIETFDIPKAQRQLEAALQEATESLERVKRQGESKLAQFQADVLTQKSTLELNKSKLARDLKQLEAAKIHAPQGGLVVYGGGGDRRFSSESMIEEGAVIRNRQEIIKLPDISEMRLTIKIHESYINNVERGQAAYVVLDAVPDHRFRGYVSRVAPLPDSSSRWMNPNLKVYVTEIRITDPMPNVKPGVSARAEVVITNLLNVLTVPLQAVTTRKGQQVVYLAEDPAQPVPVSVGHYNTKFIEISSGVKEGDRVMLTPPYDSQDKDLGNAIIEKGDALPAVETNGLNRAPVREPELERTGEGEFNPGQRRPGGEGGARRRGQRPEGDTTSGRGDSGNPGQGGGPANREEMMKQFDTNGDGQLDETERAAMREKFGGRRRGGNTNGAPTRPQGPPDGSR